MRPRSHGRFCRGRRLARGLQVFRRSLKMALFIQQALVCFAALLLALSCARVGNPPPANVADDANVAPPDSPSSAPEVFTLSPEDQTDEALAAARRSDAEGRGASGQPPQLTPQEHMRRAAIYQANRAFEEARAHWRALIERYPTDPNVPAAQFGI